MCYVLGVAVVPFLGQPRVLWFDWAMSLEKTL